MSKSKLKVFCSLSKKIVTFSPKSPNHIKMYICGPTVYDSPHIGHARTYVMFDVITRVLMDYFNYDVTYVMNITDIDDKIINRSNERNISMAELTQKYTDEFFASMDKLNVLKPAFVTRVTDYVDKIVLFIERLVKLGTAYESEGSVYFDLEKYMDSERYPLLKDKVSTNAEAVNTDKKNLNDFVLWKKSKDNEPKYESPWGYGRPGWHIECSVMATDILGDSIDIHAGGIDLAFPHHDNELAQCHAYFQKSPWINYFLHTGHLNINGLKMSKSLKNFTTIDEVLMNVTPRQLRILFLHHKWNSDMNYEVEQLKFAEKVDKKIFNFLSVADSLTIDFSFDLLTENDKKMLSRLTKAQKRVHKALLSNFNTFRVMRVLVKLITRVNSCLAILHPRVVFQIKEFVLKVVKAFGLVEKEQINTKGRDSIARLLCDFRNDVRSLAKNKHAHKDFFASCDRIRDEIREHGYIIEDKVDGSCIRKV